jgi:hypothetical protein
MDTANVRGLMRFAMTIFAALAACTCLCMEKSAGCVRGPIEARVSSDLRALRDAMLLYEKDTGVWPDSMSNFMERPGGLEGWEGPYLLSRPVDFWDEEYLLFKNEAGIRVGTFGADSLPGGKKDYFIDIETGEINHTGVTVSPGVPGFIRWGWLLSTAAALALAVLLWREIRISRKHS